ncbi:MAG: hypothetical protein GF353_23555 [Candidatus Lokiarchaeota archaeon]|nr:hypothetical protein [Candidatus Lokiarchaeota archaeon]
MMSLKKIRIQLITFLLIFITLVVGFGWGMSRDEPFIKILPFDSAGAQLALIIILIVITSIIGGFFGGYVFGPLFLLVHMKIIGRKMSYGIQLREEPERFKGTFKAIFPSLMAINFSFIFASDPNIVSLIVFSDIQNYAPLMAFMFIMTITIGVSMAVFSPIWFLLDAGIVYTNKNKVEDRRDPIEVRSVGGWFHYSLKGYAGISVIITYILFLLSIFEYFGKDLHWSTPLGLIPFPIILNFLALPSIFILEITVKHRKKYILVFAKKLGITGPLEDPLNIK